VTIEQRAVVKSARFIVSDAIVALKQKPAFIPSEPEKRRAAAAKCISAGHAMGRVLAEILRQNGGRGGTCLPAQQTQISAMLIAMSGAASAFAMNGATAATKTGFSDF